MATMYIYHFKIYASVQNTDKKIFSTELECSIHKIVFIENKYFKFGKHVNKIIFVFL